MTYFDDEYEMYYEDERADDPPGPLDEWLDDGDEWLDEDWGGNLG
jgi:hypothetical protein